jgi:CBS domain-containing protein
MTTSVRTCRPDDSLASVAKLLWDGDCGCAPVVEDGEHLVGMITDRDICMATGLSGCSPSSLSVSDTMSTTVHACRPHDPVSAAERLMQINQVRRLPVVDAEERLVGILSLNDIARAYAGEKPSGAGAVEAREVAETLAAVCRRQAGAAAAA